MANDLNQKHQGQAQNLLFSTYFLNIDENKTNFDRLSAELAVIKHKFSVIALAETNTDECNKDLYKLSNEYTPVYSSKIENKVKGSGVALYVKNDFSFNIWNELSSCNKKIETLFIKITNTSAPIVIGVVYRPPSGDIEEFNKEIELILSKLPSKKSYILGDYNINMLDLNTKGQADFEETVISNGYLPLISISAHHQPGCQKTCIDNTISNQPVGNILASGTIAGQTSKHVGIFQISDLNSSEITDKKLKLNTTTHYNNENLQSFVTILSQNLEEPESVTESFEKFSEIFKLSNEQSCKLAIPKTTRRNFVNNPWMTAGIKKNQ